MNHCHRCDCDFTQPGTCNCFAPQRYAPVYPYYPWGVYPYQPYVPYPLGGGTWVTNPSVGGTTITWHNATTENVFVVGNNVDINSLEGVPWSYTAGKTPLAATAGFVQT